MVAGLQPLDSPPELIPEPDEPNRDSVEPNHDPLEPAVVESTPEEFDSQTTVVETVNPVISRPELVSALPQPEVVEEPPAESRSSLEAAIAALKIPPDWYDSVEVHYDTNHPWKDGRLEIRRLLALGGESSREAMKLTCIYREKADIADGHEYPMYLYMGGEYAWATKAYIEFTQALLADPDSYDHIQAFLSLVSCYTHFGELEKALDTLNAAMDRLPEPPWRIARQADIQDGFGDAYARMGDAENAKKHYKEAVRLYPTAKPPYGGHLLKRRADKVQSKLDLLDYQSLETASLRDGTYRTRALGYSGDKDLHLTVSIRAGRIADIKIDHAEKIDQGATVIIPQRIIARQSLQVDAITGATVTCDGIVDGVFRALKQAGLQ